MRWQPPALLVVTIAVAFVLPARTGQVPPRPVDPPRYEQGKGAQSRPAIRGKGGIRLEVGDNFQQIVDANPAGTRFVIASGVHRMQRVQPKDDMEFVGEPGAVMSGAKVLTSFDREGSLWVASGQTQQGWRHPCGYHRGCWLEGHERDNYPEDLFIDGVRLRHVSSKSQVGPGRWFFDYERDRIYIGDDPTGKLVETSVTGFAFVGPDASGVVIDNLTIRHYANPTQRGAIHAFDPGSSSRGPGRNWTIRHVDVSHNHAIGVALGPGGHLHNSRLAHNGQLGLRGRQGNDPADAPLVVENNEIAYNLQLGYNPGWEGGAMKIVSSTGTIFQNNWVHNNSGFGIWFDINNFDTVIRSNLSEHNELTGIFYEISYGNTAIYWNTVRHNGEGQPGGFGAGIRISNSRDVDLYENAVDSNERGILLTHSNRGTGADGLWETANVKVRDNDIRMLTGTSGFINETDNDAYVTSKGIVFEDNTYRLDGTWRFSWTGGWGGPHSWSAWQGFGNDPSGFVTDAQSRPKLPSGATDFLEMPYGPE